jgi:RsiW-degrading membrane proteinase PrsW (M82 family)
MVGGMGVSILLGFIPMFFFAWFIYWLDRYEKEPLLLLVAAFLWGAVISAGVSFILNTLFGAGVYYITGSEGAANFSVSSIIAPIIEELAKGFAVLMILLVLRTEFDSILDGIIYGAVTALGFAATENAYYIFSMGFQISGWAGLWELAFIRIILVGWQHPFYTAFIGIGFGIARMNKSALAKLSAPLGGLFLAIFTHSLHNTLAPLLAYQGTFGGLIFASTIDWLGWGLMLLFIIILINKEKKLLQIHLQEEVKYNLITKNQLNMILSYSARIMLRMRILGSDLPGGIKALKTLNQQAGELAHKKNQFLKLGNESQNIEIIQGIRKKMYQASLVLRPITEQL